MGDGTHGVYPTGYKEVTPGDQCPLSKVKLHKQSPLWDNPHMETIELMAEEEWRERLRAAIHRSGKSAREVSLEAGLSDTAVRDILNGKSRSPRVGTMREVARVLGITLQDLRFLETSAEPTPDDFRGLSSEPARRAREERSARKTLRMEELVHQLETATSDDVSPMVIPREALVGEADLPVYTSAEGGDGAMLVSFDAVEYVRRPEPLAKAKGGFGMIVTGDSMSPAFEPGDTALINPHRPCLGGDDVLVVLTDGGGTQKALLKRMVKRDDRAVTLKQWNPAKTFDIPAESVLGMYRVVGKYARR